MNYRTLLAGGLAAIVSCTSPEPSYSQKIRPSPPAVSTPQSAYTTKEYDQMLEIAVGAIQTSDQAFRDFFLKASKPLFKDPQYQSLNSILDKATNAPIGKQDSIIRQLRGRYFRIKYFLSLDKSKDEKNKTLKGEILTPSEEFRLPFVYLILKAGLSSLEKQAMTTDRPQKDSTNLNNQIKNLKGTLVDILEILETSDFVPKTDHKFINDEKKLLK